ncbi:MAG: hypothetical protein IJR07_09950 [Bacteroidaceae bacterium]|nr:hypothetical protein [Bacteroidaceae bacterium]
MRKLKVIILCVCGLLPSFCFAQSLEEVIKLAQDSAITAFQSRYEYESYQAQNAAFEALRRPQLTLQFTPNYQRVVSDPSRDDAYNQHLTVLEKYWTTYYHLLTLIQYE